MKKGIWVIVALLGFAAWAEVNLPLACEGVTFSTEDGWTAPWFVEAGGGSEGGDALCSPEALVTNEYGEVESSIAYARMEGAGILTFKYKVSHNNKSWRYWYDFSIM